MSPRAGLHRLVAPMLLLAVAAGCGGSGELSDLRRQGPGGEAAADLIAAHGGLAAFYGLGDLECRVQVEKLDPAGALVGVADELHRFEAAPPPRYLLRRTGAQVIEWGLSGEEGWLRVDGVPRSDPSAGEAAAAELWLRWVLNRAPFSLADPGVRVQLQDGSVDTLVAEWPGGDERGSRRMILQRDPDSGRLARVTVMAPGQSLTSVLRAARAAATSDEDGALLVSRWDLADVSPQGEAGLTDLRWEMVQIRTGNGFSDALYAPAGE